MIWETWNDFFAMGGYALYVWGSLLVVFAFMAGEVVALTSRRKAVLAQLANTRDANAGAAMKRSRSAQ